MANTMTLQEHAEQHAQLLGLPYIVANDLFDSGGIPVGGGGGGGQTITYSMTNVTSQGVGGEISVSSTFDFVGVLSGTFGVEAYAEGTLEGLIGSVWVLLGYWDLQTRADSNLDTFKISSGEFLLSPTKVRASISQIGTGNAAISGSGAKVSIGVIS